MKKLSASWCSPKGISIVSGYPAESEGQNTVRRSYQQRISFVWHPKEQMA